MRLKFAYMPQSKMDYRFFVPAALLKQATHNTTVPSCKHLTHNTPPPSNKPLKALLPIPLFLISLPSQQRMHFNPFRSDDRLIVVWQRRLHTDVCRRRMYGMRVMREVFSQIIGFCLVIPTENRTFAADYRRVICGIPGFLLLFTDKSTCLAEVSQTKETAWIGKCRYIHWYVLLLPLMLLGYARHPC